MKRKRWLAKEEKLRTAVEKIGGEFLEASGFEDEQPDDEASSESDPHGPAPRT